MTALVVHDELGGQILKTDVDGAWHFYNLIGGERVDFTLSQFETPISYEDLPSNRDEALNDTSPEQYQLLRERVSMASASVVEIRDAVAEDAPLACQVMQRSIAELCVADHRNDPEILARWLSNKTPEMFMSWITQPGNSLLVAVDGGAILAVGCVNDAGRINLNYVSPDARFRGISRALLGTLEARAVERGSTRCTLNSTETARRFYRANGYVEDGPPVDEFGAVSGYPMSKLLGNATI